MKISDPDWDSYATFPSWTTPEVGERQRVIFLWVPSEWKTCDEKEVRDLSRPTMSLALVAKPFKRPILQEQFIKGFIKLGDQMCELNYTGTKIEIGVKLGDQKCNFTYKKWSLYRELLRCWHVAVTRGIDTWQSTLRLTVNVQIGLSGPILQGFIKLRDQICELNYRGTKSVIGDKVGDQFCNFTKYLILAFLHK